MKGDGENQHQITLDDGSYVQWRKDGIKVLGCALGLDNFCQNTIKNTANKIERDLECLDVFPFVHQRFELATHCSNTRITYFLLATKLHLSGPITAQLDQSFNVFYARLLSFQKDYATGKYAQQYQLALRQFRLLLKNGGFGATGSNSIISAAFYLAVAQFEHWVEKHSDLELVSWLQSHVQANPELGFAYLTDSLTEAMADLDRNWNIKDVHLNGVPAPGDEEQEADPEAVMTLPTIKCLLANDPKRTSQKFISNHIQKMLLKRLFDDLDQSGQQRL